MYARYELCAFLIRAMDGKFDHFTPAELDRTLAKWSLQPIENNGKLTAVMMVHGNEVHVASDPSMRARWLSRRVIREMLGPVLERYGSVTTRVTDGNVKGHEFVQRLGFQRNGAEYVLKEFAHA